MKKGYFIIALITIILLTGCGNDKITGKYKRIDNDKDNYLILYENGSCHWKYGMYLLEDPYTHKFSDYFTFDWDTNECHYDYNDDEITISTGSGTYPNKCKISKRTIDCGSNRLDEGIYKK